MMQLNPGGGHQTFFHSDWKHGPRRAESPQGFTGFFRYPGQASRAGGRRFRTESRNACAEFPKFPAAR
jgi:hypothetical protein